MPVSTEKRQLVKIGAKIYIGDMSRAHFGSDNREFVEMDHFKSSELKGAMLAGTPAIVMSKPVRHIVKDELCHDELIDEYFIKVVLEGSDKIFFVENLEYSLLDSQDKLRIYLGNFF